MAGDPTKVDMWGGADVYKAPVGTPFPTDVSTPWASPWEAVGLLDGDEGFVMARDDETSEHFAWGGLLVKKKRSKHQRTIRFVALEDNEIVFELVNPGSERSTTGGLTTSVVKIPVSAEFAFGFELREGNKVKRRFVERGEVTEVADITESETDPAVYDMTTTLYPDAEGVLYTELSGTVTP